MGEEHSKQEKQQGYLWLEAGEVTEAEARGRSWRALEAILKALTPEEIGNHLEVGFGGQEGHDIRLDS